jgi:glycosyltransferase involved in cell wall biosynthesis
MHIGLVVYGDLGQTSGGYRYDRKLVSYCRQAGDTVEVVSLDGDSPELRDEGLSPQTRSKLDRDVDVLFVDGLCYQSVGPHLDALTEPATVVGLAHYIASDDPTTRWARLRRPCERQFYRRVDGVITTSEFLRDRVRTLAPGTHPRLVAPPAGRTDGTAVTAAEVRARATDDPLQVVFVGSLTPRKDPKTVLRALSRLPHRQWALALVGDQTVNPAYATSTLQLAEALEIDGNVTATGTVSDTTLEAILEQSHVCCVPSKYEAFGMVSLEAMEYGVVPLASAVGGAGEFITDSESGFLVDPGAPQEIADILRRLDAERSRLATVGIDALSVAREHPKWETTLGRIRAFLQRLRRSV